MQAERTLLLPKVEREVMYIMQDEYVPPPDNNQLTKLRNLAAVAAAETTAIIALWYLTGVNLLSR